MSKIYRGSKSFSKNKKIDTKKEDLIYRGVSKNTKYYTLAKIRSAQKKRRLFHSGLELYAARKYLYVYIFGILVYFKFLIISTLYKNFTNGNLVWLHYHFGL